MLDSFRCHAGLAAASVNAQIRLKHSDHRRWIAWRPIRATSCCTLPSPPSSRVAAIARAGRVDLDSLAVGLFIEPTLQLNRHRLDGTSKS